MSESGKQFPQSEVPLGNDQSGMASDAHPGTHPDMEPCTLACSLTCALKHAHPGMVSGVEPGTHPDMDPEFTKIRCQKGYSAAQINLIGLLLGVGSKITPYEQLACQLEQLYHMKKSGAAVRGLLDRLAARGIVRRKQAREGMLQGLLFLLDRDRICPYIRPPESAHPDMDPGMEPAMQPRNHPGVHPDAHPAPSILEEIDRKNLSISSSGTKNHRALLENLSEEDIQFHWPELAGVGFSTHQLRQIIHRLQQIGEGLANVMRGMTHAEWELAHQCMRDSKGNSIEAPLNWVFHILATQGYYPLPAKYVSPAEQAERDRLKTLKHEQEAREARYSIELAQWLAKLSIEERRAILGPESGRKDTMPEEVCLRLHFKNKIWPKFKENV